MTLQMLACYNTECFFLRSFCPVTPISQTIMAKQLQQPGTLVLLASNSVNVHSFDTS